jgi:hypothetical protein
MLDGIFVSVRMYVWENVSFEEIILWVKLKENDFGKTSNGMS